MKKQWAIAAFAAFCAGTGGQAHAEGPPSMADMPPQVQLAFNLGTAGLLTEFSSYDTFATVQGRIGQSRAQVELSKVGGPLTGYEDSVDVFALPFDYIRSLPGSGGQSFLRFGGVLNTVSGDGNITKVDSRLTRMEVQYLHAPNLDTLFAIGAYYEKADIELKHNGGDLERDGFGIRADLLKKFSPNWGIAARADLNFAENSPRIPLGPIGTYALDQDETRFYFQADLVGTFMTHDAAWIPQGWIFRPGVSAVYQQSSFDIATDSFGAPVSGTVGRSDEYATLAVSARLEDAKFVPGRFAPYVEVGLEHEVINDLKRTLDDPTIAHLVIGGSINLGKGARMDIEYGRHDGLDGLRSDQAVTVHVGMMF